MCKCETRAHGYPSQDGETTTMYFKTKNGEDRPNQAGTESGTIAHDGPNVVGRDCVYIIKRYHRCQRKGLAEGEQAACPTIPPTRGRCPSPLWSITTSTP